MTNNFEKYIDWIESKFDNPEILIKKIDKLEEEVFKISDNEIETTADTYGGILRSILNIILNYIYKIQFESNNVGYNDPDYEEFIEIETEYEKLIALKNIIYTKEVNLFHRLDNLRRVASNSLHDMEKIEIQMKNNFSKATIVNAINDIAIIFNYLCNSRERVKFDSYLYYKRNDIKNSTEIELKEKVVLEDNRGIKISDASIVNILYNNDKVFKIPLYQRGYAWEEKQIQTLLDDIINKSTSEIGIDAKHHFFGNVSFIADYKDGKEIIKVVDGQQRLTTILLLLKAIHKKYMLIINNPELIDTQLNILIKSDLPLTRVDTSLNNDVLVKIWNDVEITNPLELDTNIWKAFSHIWKFISKMNIDMMNDLLVSTTKLIVGVNWIKDANEFELFESLNSKGKKLSNFDIFKNYLYSLIDKDVEINNETKITNRFEIMIEKKFSLLSTTKKQEAAKEIFMKMFIEYFDNKKVKSDNIFNQFKYALTNWREKENKPSKNLSFEQFENLLLDISRFILSTLLTQTKDIGVWENIPLLFEIKDDVKYIINSGTYSSTLIHYLFTSNNFEFDNQGDLKDVIDISEVRKMFKLIEAWKVRRDVSFDSGDKSLGEPIRIFNKRVKMINENYYENLRELIFLQEDFLIMPSIKKFKDSLKTKAITVTSASETILYRIYRYCGGDENDKIYSSEIIESSNIKRNEYWNNFISDKNIKDEEILLTIGNHFITELSSEIKKHKVNDLTYLEIWSATNSNLIFSLGNGADIKDLKDITDINDYLTKRNTLISELAGETFDV